MKKCLKISLILILVFGLCACASNDVDNSKFDEDKTDNTVNEDMVDAESDKDVEKPTYHIYDGDEEVPNYEDYGTLETKRQEYPQGSDELCYYYEIDEYYLNGDFDESLNETLKAYYAGWEELYAEDVTFYGEMVDEEISDASMPIPYNYLHLVYMSYVGEDYVSFVFNNVAYLGGAHPYSQFDGLVLDCNTGEEVSFMEFLPSMKEENVWKGVSQCMGIDGDLSIEDADFYITKDNVVFFYRMPNYWNDVSIKREK